MRRLIKNYTWAATMLSSTLLATAFLFGFQNVLAAPPLVHSQEPDACLQDVFGKVPNCTANDTSLGILVVADPDDQCEDPDNDGLPPFIATVNIQGNLVSTAAERNDLGMILAVDGGDALTGECTRNYLPAPLDSDPDLYNPGSSGFGNGLGPFYDAEDDNQNNTDICGDLVQDDFTFVDFMTLDANGVAVGNTESDIAEITITCVDTIDGGGDAIPDGKVDIGNCTHWDNTSNNMCEGAYSLFPNTSAKCVCSRANTTLDMPGFIKLVKVVVNDSGGTAGASEWTLTADNPSDVSDLISGQGTPDNAENTQATFGPRVMDPGEVYDLSESGPVGYDPGNDFTCTSDGNTMVFDSSNQTVSVGPGETATCTITNNDIAPKLTLEKLVINDEGGSANATAFTMSATGSQASLSGTGSTIGIPVDAPDGTTSAAALTGDVFATIEYTLSESGPSGYEQVGNWTCTDGTLIGDKLTLALADVATCRVVNDDLPPMLTLRKQVINDDGGAAKANEWKLKADGPADDDPFDGFGTLLAPDSDIASSGKFEVGNDVTYVLSEYGGPAGYDNGSGNAPKYSCTGDTAGFNAEDQTITMSGGEDAVCTIVNDDIAPTLTLVKKVFSNYGGDEHASAWTLTATDGDDDTPIDTTGLPATGNMASVGPTDITAGVTYTLSEDGPAGYDDGSDGLPFFTCTDDGGGFVQGTQSITLALDTDAVCTIENYDVPPTLTLIKEVVNDQGGNNLAVEWTLTADGDNGGFSAPGTSNGNDLIATNGPNEVWSNTLYTLSESGGPSGYDNGEGNAPLFSCLGDTDQWTAPAQTIQFNEGEDATCRIINNDIPPELTLIKQVINDQGGDEGASEWILTAEGANAGFSGAGAPNAEDTEATNGPNMVWSNTVYTLSESGPDGYDDGTDGTPVFACIGDDGMWSVGAQTIEFNEGESATCTIINDDIPPELTLIKQVINDQGGNNLAAEWTLTAAGDNAGFSGQGISDGNDLIATNGPNMVWSNTVYTLSESGPDGYDDGIDGTPVFACIGDDGMWSVGAQTIEFNEGESATCTIINNDIPPELTLIKQVINDDGGLNGASEWVLTAEGTDGGFSGTGTPNGDDTEATNGPNEVWSNTVYTLSESGPAGYDDGAGGTPKFSCTTVNRGTWTVAAQTIIFDEGGDATCVIVNDDIPPTITVNKTLVPADDDGLFNLLINGATAGTGGNVGDGGTTGIIEVMANTTNSIGEEAANDSTSLGHYDTSVSGSAKCPALLSGSPQANGNVDPDLILDEDIVCTITNERRIRVNLVKTFNMITDDLIDQVFELYAGPDGFGGDIIASDTTLGAVLGLLDFDNIHLDIDGMYTMCERNIGAGTFTTWYIDDGDTTGVIDINDTPIDSYNPDDPESLGNRCVDLDFGPDGLNLQAGDTLKLLVENTTPEGEARTPGYWSNWSSCTNGNQFAKATIEFEDGLDPRHYTLDEILPQTIGILELLGDSSGTPYGPDAEGDAMCDEAVLVLKNREQTGRHRPQASDPAYKLARSLLAYRANEVAGAYTCPAAAAAADTGQGLLAFYGYNGQGTYLKFKGKKGTQQERDDAALALVLHGTLDAYNNNDEDLDCSYP